MTNVDINCDLGEGYGPYRMGDDAVAGRLRGDPAVG